MVGTAGLLGRRAGGPTLLGAVCAMTNPLGDPGNSCGTVHRVVRWGHPQGAAQGYVRDSAGVSRSQRWEKAGVSPSSVAAAGRYRAG